LAVWPTRECLPGRHARIGPGQPQAMWWSWGDLNPRPQAFIAQFYMFSDLI